VDWKLSGCKCTLTEKQPSVRRAIIAVYWPSQLSNSIAVGCTLSLECFQIEATSYYHCFVQHEHDFHHSSCVYREYDSTNILSLCYCMLY
jgi:hypothetical protein